MNENNTRPVLADVTNRILKRRISQISEDCETLNGEGQCFSEKSKRSCVSPSICSGFNSCMDNFILSISKDQTENKNPIFTVPGDAIVEIEDENDSVEEQEMNTNNNLDDLSTFPESQESQSSGLEKCVGLMGFGSSDSNSGVDLIKSCSCSFCSKAAYIWSDLHYQDIKGRISVLKKSQKEANILVQRSIRGQGIDSNKLSKVESGLMGQFRSLFLHMEDIFSRECNQLEGSFLTLKDLRDNCKSDLDSTIASSSGKQ